MIYLLFLIISVTHLSVLNEFKPIHFGKLLLYGVPVIILWVLLIGGQYDVGTDYFNYLEIFRSGDVSYVKENRGELLFSGIVSSLWSLGIRGQGIYLVLALIWSIILFGIMYKCVGSRYLYLFLFVFIVFPGMFNNQMNGIRQYFAIYILTLGICFLRDERYFLTILFFLFSIYLHRSAFFIVPIILILYFFVSQCHNPLFLYVSIFTGIILSFLITPNIIAKFVPSGDVYFSYLDSDLVVSFSLSTKLPKYIYLPLMFDAINIFSHEKFLDERNMRFFTIGIIGYAIKLASLSVGMIHRLGLYFDILECVPLVYLLIWYNRNNRVGYYAVIMYMLIPYAIKTLISTTGEYSYDSFLLH